MDFLNVIELVNATYTEYPPTELLVAVNGVVMTYYDANPLIIFILGGLVGLLCGVCVAALWGD